MAASIDRADNAKFLEQFRYTIVASQLLSGHSLMGPHPPPSNPDIASATSVTQGLASSTEGIVASILGALALSIVLSWATTNSPAQFTKKRLPFLVVLGAASILLGQVFMRRQWLRYRREQALTEVASFISASQEFDGASSAALSLIQEVELVSRGYRM